MAQPGTSALQLPSKLTIRHPLAKLQAFADEEYETYDGIATPQDSTLTIHDILLSVMMNSRLNAVGGRSIWRSRDGVERCLVDIPTTVALSDDDSIIPWSALRSLFDEFGEIKHAWLAVATKILHKKRPLLIPMLDSVLEGYYRDAYPDGWRGPSLGPLAVNAMRHFRDDLLAVRPQLEALAAEIQARDRPLALVRVLEILIWIEREPNGYYRQHGCSSTDETQTQS